jgi:cbb3-type cytochrome oxidase maturation protein
LIAIGFFIVFIWNVKSGQYQDTVTPSIRILFDDNKVEENKSNNIQTKNKEQ